MKLKFRIIRNSIIGILLVIGINLLVLYLVGFPAMALIQIKKYFILLLLLIIGFGVQIGLYTYLKHKNLVCSATMATSGGISAISMILCCSHYAVNLIPFISISTATFLTNYTFELLIFGLISNIAGIIWMLTKIKKLKEVKNGN
ncbi:MAG: hypothetical protein KKD48_04670 [Nanoarchaeota archaeon]|nr:hypothetical protein [Nanoarchaeota archaeon]